VCEHFFDLDQERLEKILHNVQSKRPSMGRSNNEKNERPETDNFDTEKSNAL
jgi:hypothetical protein